MIYTDEKFRLDDVNERKHYTFHHNSIEDENYVAFLNRVISPALKYLCEGMKGLDFGCGPNPVLSELLKQRNFDCDNYDCFFFPNLDRNKRYDFVFATECFEHFYNPKEELSLISGMLKKDGFLCVMTEYYPSKEGFGNWYYKNDPTHVCFYKHDTLSFIEKEFGYSEIYNDNKRVFILKKL